MAKLSSTRRLPSRGPTPLAEDPAKRAYISENAKAMGLMPQEAKPEEEAKPKEQPAKAEIVQEDIAPEAAAPTPKQDTPRTSRPRASSNSAADEATSSLQVRLRISRETKDRLSAMGLPEVGHARFLSKICREGFARSAANWPKDNIIVEEARTAAMAEARRYENYGRVLVTMPTRLKDSLVSVTDGQFGLLPEVAVIAGWVTVYLDREISSRAERK
ncbi:hypothetical protein FGG78_27995 [Thioclava sp. BHET1]|nr:hypothetical protein FGG78_27995 [Thioclava sp. BHET1]